MSKYRIITQKNTSDTWHWTVLKRNALFYGKLTSGYQCRNREDAIQRAEAIIERDRKKDALKREAKRSRQMHPR